MWIKIVSYAYLNVPESTIVQRDGYIRLPSGNMLKPYVTLELNDTTDLTASQLERYGCSLQYDGSDITPTSAIEWSRVGRFSTSPTQRINP